MFTMSRGINSIVLSNPELDDTHDIDTNLINQQTRHGEPLIYKADDWPIIEKRNYIFNNLSEDKIQELILFLVAVAGMPINIIDYSGNEFAAIITNTDYIITILRDDCVENIPLELTILQSTGSGSPS